MYINAFWLHFNMILQNFAQKLTYTKTIFFRLSTALIRPDYVTDDKRSLSTCLNILIAAFWTILLIKGLYHFWEFISVIRTPCIIKAKLKIKFISFKVEYLINRKVRSN